jgi:uncharacterized membrane protein YkoI
MQRKTKFIVGSLAMLLAVGVGQFGVMTSFAQPEQPAQVETADPCVLFGRDSELEAEMAEQAEVGEVEDGGEADALQESETDDANEDDGDYPGETGDEDEAGNEDVEENSALVGSIALDEAQFDAMTDAEECEALISLATVTPETARAAAETETGSVAVKVEIEDENGFLVYEVEMEDGSEVTVDAGNATILLIEPTEAEDAA